MTSLAATLWSASKGIPEVSLFCSMLQKAGLTSYLTDETATTAFLPSNTAVLALLKAAQLSQEELVKDRQTLKQIRLYHLASGSTLLTKTIADGEALLTPTRLPGKSLFNQKLGEGPSAQIIVQGAYSQAQVLIADIVASSTVAIHVVDSILLPFQLPSMRPRVFPSLIDALVNTPELSSLHAASTALVTVEADDEGGSEMLAMLQTPSMNVTVFAPNNTAIQELIAELQLPEDAVLATGKFVYSNLVTPLLSQHMVKGRQLIANSITAGDSISMESMAGQELSSLRNVTGTFVLSAHGGARVVRQDDLAGLGVVHIIDGVLSERQ